MSLRPFNSRNSVHVPSYKSIQYCAVLRVSHFERDNGPGTPDSGTGGCHRPGALLVQEGVSYRLAGMLSATPPSHPILPETRKHKMNKKKIQWILKYLPFKVTSKKEKARLYQSFRPNLILRCSILRKDVFKKQKHHLLRRKRGKQGFFVMQM